MTEPISLTALEEARDNQAILAAEPALVALAKAWLAWRATWHTTSGGREWDALKTAGEAFEP